MEKDPKIKDVAGLVKAAQFAGAGTDDGFWTDVAGQLEKVERSKDIPVEERLTGKRD
jgi:hypothetical protein